MPDPVIIQRYKRHVVLTLNRPGSRNPLPYRPEDGLLPILKTLEKDDAIRAVVITGAAPTFCSGMDLNGLKALQKASKRQNLADAKQIRAFFEFLRTYPKPTIAAVNGPAVAGGVGLVLLCDAAIWAENASVCFSEVKIGFIPALVGVYAQRLLGARQAQELLLSARTIKPDEALRLGLAQEVVPDKDLLTRAEAWAERFCAVSPDAVALTKCLLGTTQELPLEKALDEATKVNAEARSTPAAQEGIASFLEKRLPKWL
jgi:methylglutaconyl-CoA hydratase